MDIKDLFEYCKDKFKNKKVEYFLAYDAGKKEISLLANDGSGPISLDVRNTSYDDAVELAKAFSLTPLGLNIKDKDSSLSAWFSP